MNILVNPKHIHLVQDSCFTEVPEPIAFSKVQNTVLVGGKKYTKKSLKKFSKKYLKKSLKKSVRRPRKKSRSKTKTSMNAKNNRFRSRVYRAYSKRRTTR